MAQLVQGRSLNQVTKVSYNVDQLPNRVHKQLILPPVSV